MDPELPHVNELHNRPSFSFFYVITALIFSIGCNSSRSEEPPLLPQSDEPFKEGSGETGGGEADAPSGTETPDRSSELEVPEYESYIVPREGRGDTGPLTCQGDGCPSARLSWIDFPTSTESATSIGCRIPSNKNGIGFGSLLSLAGGQADLNDYLQPNEEGVVSSVLINYISSWSSGESSADQGLLGTYLLDGVHRDQRFELSNQDHEEVLKPFTRFLSVTGGLYQIPPSQLIMRLPIKDLVIPVLLNRAELSAHITLDSTGFNLSEGILVGFLSEESIMDILTYLKEICVQQDPALDACRSISTFLSDDLQRDLDLLLSVLGGYEVRLSSEGEVQACEGQACNALGVCAHFEMESVQVSGLNLP